jgi:hypothetical protein
MSTSLKMVKPEMILGGGVSLSWFIIVSCFLAFYINYNNNAVTNKDAFNNYPDTPEGVDVLNTGFSFLIFFAVAWIGFFIVKMKDLTKSTSSKTISIGSIIVTLFLSGSLMMGAVAVGERDKEGSVDSEDVHKLTLASLILFLLGFLVAPLIVLGAINMKKK